MTAVRYEPNAKLDGSLTYECTPGMTAKTRYAETFQAAKLMLKVASLLLPDRVAAQVTHLEGFYVLTCAMHASMPLRQMNNHC